MNKRRINYIKGKVDLYEVCDYFFEELFILL